MTDQERKETVRQLYSTVVRSLVGRGDLGTIVSLPFEAVVAVLEQATEGKLEAFREALARTPPGQLARTLDRQEALLARMAGNIAAGLVGPGYADVDALDDATQQQIASVALGIARSIVRELRENPGP